MYAHGQDADDEALDYVMKGCGVVIGIMIIIVICLFIAYKTFAQKGI